MSKFVKKIIVITLVLTMIISSVLTIPVHAEEPLSYRDAFIEALLNDQSFWYKYHGASVGYQGAITFADLNFDGKLELIMQYGGGSMLNCDADAFYFDGTTVYKAGSDGTSANDTGFQNTFNGYYDTVNKKYRLLGSATLRSGIYYNWSGKYELFFDGQDLSTKYYCSREATSVGANKYSYTYYNGANGYGSSKGYSTLSESQYNKIADDKMKDLVDINMHLEYIDCSGWKKMSTSAKRTALQKAYDGFYYDKYVIKAYTAFPTQTIGKDQEVRILFELSKSTDYLPIEDFSINIEDTNIVNYVTHEKSSADGIIATFKGINPGSTTITFTDNKTGACTELPIYVDELCLFYRCQTVPQPDASIGSIIIANFECTQNNDGTHTIEFDAYNRGHSYGAVCVYDSNGGFKTSVPLDPRCEGQGVEKYFINGFKYAWLELKSTFDPETPFYTLPQNAKHTKVVLPNVSVNSEIVITSDGAESIYPTFYTAVDVFVQSVLTASSIEVNLSQKRATTTAVIKAAVKSLPESAIHSATKEISTAMAHGSTKESATKAYQIIFKLFQSVGFDFGEIIKSTLSGMIYGAVDSIVTTAIPPTELLTIYDKVEEIAWPVVDYTFYSDRGRIEVHVCKHGTENFLSNSAIIVKQAEDFNSDTVLDAYKVTNESEINGLKDTFNNENNDYNFYNITLREKGIETQPDGNVTVQIPVDNRYCKVYRVENGLPPTDMQATYNNGYMEFETNHFSYYAIEYDNSVLLGDADGDKDISIMDATEIQLAVARIITLNEKSKMAADADNDGDVSILDATQVQLYVAKVIDKL